MPIQQMDYSRSLLYLGVNPWGNEPCMCSPELCLQLERYGGNLLFRTNLTPTLTLNLTPTKAYREPSGKEGAQVLRGKVCVARPQIDVPGAASTITRSGKLGARQEHSNPCKDPSLCPIDDTV